MDNNQKKNVTQNFVEAGINIESVNEDIKNFEEKSLKIQKIIKMVSFVLVLIIILWLSLVLFESYRVNNDKRPIICLNQVKDIEDDDEYAMTCYGILYKYKEYYYSVDDSISARELTMLFKEFVRGDNEWDLIIEVGDLGKW